MPSEGVVLPDSSRMPCTIYLGASAIWFVIAPPSGVPRESRMCSFASIYCGLLRPDLGRGTQRLSSSFWPVVHLSKICLSLRASFQLEQKGNLWKQYREISSNSKRRPNRLERTEQSYLRNFGCRN